MQIAQTTLLVKLSKTTERVELVSETAILKTCRRPRARRLRGEIEISGGGGGCDGSSFNYYIRC